MERLLSAVITTYGRSFNAIERSIKSVMNQSYKNIEIVLVDDNHSNSEFRMSIQSGVKKYPNVVYVKHEKNMGAQAARNTGVKSCHGEVVAFLDDDDEWLPEKIQKQMSLLKDDIGLVYSKGFRIDEDTGEMTPYDNERNFKTEVTFRDMLYGDYIGTTTQVLIPKNVIEKVGYFDLNQPARQDYEMWIRISRQYRCVGINERLFRHYIHQGEQISKSCKKSIAGMENIYNKYKKDYKRYPLAHAHILFFISGLYKMDGDKRQGIRYFFIAISKLPAVLVFNSPQAIKIITTRRSKL